MKYPFALAGLAGLILTAGAAAANDPPALGLPVDCEIGSVCLVQNYVDADPSSGAKDFRCGNLVYDGHKGTDFRTRTMDEMRDGVAVVAAAPGVVKALRDGMADISIRVTGADAVKGREAGNSVIVDHGGGWQTQYSHLRKGSVSVVKGQQVEAGDRLGLIGLSGKTEFPHVHFSIRFAGKAVDPFTGLRVGSGCGRSEASLWSPAVAELLAYRAGGLIDAGFAPAQVKLGELMDGKHRNESLPANSSALVFWGYAFGLRGGDYETIRLFAPNGKVMAEVERRIPRDKAQWFGSIGRRLKASAWPSGLYRGLYRVERDGADGRETIIDEERVVELR